MLPLYRSWALCIDEEQGLLGFPVHVSLGLDKLLLATTRLDTTEPGSDEPTEGGRMPLAGVVLSYFCWISLVENKQQQ